MKAFVIAENEQAARELCAGARTLADEVVLVCPGVPAVPGVADKCVHIDVPEGNVIDDAYVTVNSLFDSERAEVVLAEPTRRMKALAARLAAHLDTAVITDAMEIADGVATTMFFGGVGQQKSKNSGAVALYTVGMGVFDASGAAGTDVVEEAAFQAPENAVVRRGADALPVSDVNLAAADVVIGCGRGFCAEEDLQLARDLASKVGGELGCSRPLAEGVDWFPREAYIGVSGVIVAPKVYFACGISGQMQHMVGVNRSQTVVAINKDKNAPVFKQCDYGIVGDVKTVLPALVAAL